MAAFRTLDQADVNGKRVLVRVDFNVPMKDGDVSDTTRIAASSVTINEIADKGGRVILISHFGRPKGRNQKDSLKRVAQAAARILGRPENTVTRRYHRALHKLLVQMIRPDPPEADSDDP